MDDSSHFYNTSKRLSKNEFTIQGWHFVEWNTDSEGKGTSYTDLAHIVNLTIKDNDIIDLFAQWAKNEYYIDYSPNSPTGNNNDVQGYMAASKHIYSENSYLSENKFTVAGWHFIGWNTKNDKSGVWFDDCDLVNDLTDVHNSEIKLYAQWDQNVYDIRYEPNKPTNASSVVIGSMEKTTHTYGNQSNLRANGYSLVGWHFTGWKDESGNWYAVKVISEHAFWDFDLNKYVFLRNDAYKYIGHWFNKQVDERLSWEKVQLIDVQITEELTTAWSPVTYGHLCYYVNGMLSMPGATEGFINIFEVDSETLKIDESLMLSDIEKYGLFTYEEFAEIYPINEEIFEAFNGQYLKISVGKGLITMEEIGELINHYAEFLS